MFEARLCANPQPQPAGRAQALADGLRPSRTYDGNPQLRIENPINRYLINSPMLPGMKKNADGSLTLDVQNKSLVADKEATGYPRLTARSIWS